MVDLVSCIENLCLFYITCTRKTGGNLWHWKCFILWTISIYVLPNSISAVKNISKVKWLTSYHVGHWPNCSTWSPPRYWGRFNGVVSFYKQHYFLLQYWCCISFLPPSLLAIWHSVQLDFCLIWQKRTCEEIKCRVNFHWSHFQKHQISQRLWEGTMRLRSALEEKDLSSSKLCSLYFSNINIGIMLTPGYLS